MSKIEMHEDICAELRAMYLRKNADYGDSFTKSFEEFGIISPIIRMLDKFNRIRNLSKGGDPNVPDESMEDTLLDLANYAIMTVIEIRRSRDENKKCDYQCPPKLTYDDAKVDRVDRIDPS